MRVECDHCQRLTPANLSTAGGGIQHLCGLCGMASRYTPPTSAATPVTDGSECPKCGARVKGESCPRCGLSVERMRTFVADEKVPDDLLAAWEACRAAWDDPAAHDKVAVMAMTYEKYPWLARRYRTALRDRPDDPIGAARLQRIARMLEAALRATATPPAAAPRRGGTLVALIVVLFVLALGMVYAVKTLTASQGPAAAPPSTRMPAAPSPVRPGPRGPGAGAPPTVPQRPIESPAPGR